MGPRLPRLPHGRPRPGAPSADRRLDRTAESTVDLAAEPAVPRPRVDEPEPLPREDAPAVPRPRDDEPAGPWPPPDEEPDAPGSARRELAVIPRLRLPAARDPHPLFDPAPPEADAAEVAEVPTLRPADDVSPPDDTDPVTQPLVGLVPPNAPEPRGRGEWVGRALVAVGLACGVAAAVLGAWLLGLVVFVAASVGGCVLAQREAARHAEAAARIGAQSRPGTRTP